MNPHRSKNTPQWTDIPPADRTNWQRLAATTSGIITPGNALTVVGFLIVAGALIAIVAQHYLIGLAGLIIGRGFDLLDGMAAEATKTKSPLGEAFDATFDKLGTAATLIVYAVSNKAPWWVLLGLALPHILISGISLYADRRGRRIHPSRIGKYSMAIAWLALLGIIALPAFGYSLTGSAEYIVYLAILSSVLTASYAMVGYTKQMA